MFSQYMNPREYHPVCKTSIISGGLPGREMAPFCYINCGRPGTTPTRLRLFVLGLEQNMPTKLKN